MAERPNETQRVKLAEVVAIPTDLGAIKAAEAVTEALFASPECRPGDGRVEPYRDPQRRRFEKNFGRSSN